MRGPIAGKMGLRYRLACDQRRVIDLETLTANYETLSVEWSGVNCPQCLETEEWAALASPTLNAVADGLLDKRLAPPMNDEVKAVAAVKMGLTL